MLEIVLISLTVLGGAAAFYGNYRLIRDVGSERPIRRFIMLCLVPMLVLTTLIRHYRRARTGAFIAIAGMWLMVPYAGNKLWERQSQTKESAEEGEEELDERFEKLAEAMEAAGSRTLPARPAPFDRVAEKQKLVNQLNARLAAWFQQLQSRQAALDPKDAAAVREFNADAAAYANLNEIAKSKNQELLSLHSVAKR